jgi:hypothetical protein
MYILALFLLFCLIVIITINKKLSCSTKNNFTQKFSGPLPTNYNDELLFYKQLPEDEKIIYLKITKDEKIKRYFS